jgi:hypothetical protein
MRQVGESRQACAEKMSATGHRFCRLEQLFHAQRWFDLDSYVGYCCATVAEPVRRPSWHGYRFAWTRQYGSAADAKLKLPLQHRKPLDLLGMDMSGWDVAAGR